MSKFQYTISSYRIKHLSEITGFSAHVLRKWEQRYDFLAPQRGENGYRLFDQTDLQLLLFIKSQLTAGATIGQLVSQGRSSLLAHMNSGPVEISGIQGQDQAQAEKLIEAARQGDSKGVEEKINAIIQKLGFESALTTIFFPTLRVIGELWHQGRISVQGEQFVSQPIHRLLAEHNQRQNGIANPYAVVACVPNDFHEIGAMTASQMLYKNGWKVTYLGPDSNIDMIRVACKRRQTKLTLLSCVVEPTADAMKQLIDTITKHLLPLTTVFIGGKGASLYIDWLERKGIRYIGQIDHVSELTPRSLGFSRTA